MTLHSLEGEPQIANARKQHGNGAHLAARLCGEAKDGQILVSGRVAAAIRETTALEDIGPLVLKGLTQPVSVFNVKGRNAGGLG